MPAKKNKTPRVQKKQKMDMGLMGSKAPNPDQLGLDADLMLTREQLPNPYNPKFAKLDKNYILKAYETGIKRVNQRLKELEKQGLESFSHVYNKLKSQEVKTGRGRVGFPQVISEKNIDKTSKSDLLKEYKKVYQTSERESTSVKKVREMQEEQLSRIGIDIDEMEKHPELYKEELTTYWNLFHELASRGVFEDFGLHSQEEESKVIVKQFLLDNTAPKSKASIKGMVTNIKKLWMETNQKAAQDPMHTVDQARFREFVGKYEDNSARLTASYRKMMFLLAKHQYGKGPAEPMPTDENGNRKRMFLE